MNPDLAAAVSSNPICERIGITDPERFYPETVKRIVAYCGNEFPNQDFHSAVRDLNNWLDLGMSNRMTAVLGMMMTRLARAERFHGSLYIKRSLGENSAIHSIHSALLFNEEFRRAGLLFSEAGAGLDELRKLGSLATILHDLGESFGEINSLAQRARRQALREMHEFENPVFETLLRLAYQACSEGRFYSYYQKAEALEQRLRDPLSSEFRFAELPAAVRDLGTTFPAGHDTADTEVIEAEIQRLLLAYRCMEAEGDGRLGLSPAENFIGFFGKNCERAQGTRHINRFCEKAEDYLPLRLYAPNGSPVTELSRSNDPRDKLAVTANLRTSYEMIRAFRYNEEFLAPMWEHADTPELRKLAGGMTKLVYESLAECLATGPAYIDLLAGRVPRHISEYMERVSNEGDFRRRQTARRTLIHYLNAEAERMSLAYGNTDALSSIHSREDLIALYASHAKLALDGGDIPEPGSILAGTRS